MGERHYRVDRVAPIGGARPVSDDAGAELAPSCPLCGGELDGGGVCTRRCGERRVDRMDRKTP